MEVKEEKEQERIEEKKEEKELVFDEKDLAELKETQDENTNTKASDVSSKVEKSEEQDHETVAAFTGTNNEEGAQNNEQTETSSTEVVIDEDDDIETVYEEVLVFGDGENNEPEQAVTGDATSGEVNSSNAQSVIVNKLDERSILDGIAQQLNEMGGDFTVIIDKDDIDDCEINIFSITKNHGTHALCGMTTCDRLHYRFDQENQGTYDATSQVNSDQHAQVTYNDLPLGETAYYFTNGGDFALQFGDLTINQAQHINGNLRL